MKKLLLLVIVVIAVASFFKHHLGTAPTGFTSTSGAAAPVTAAASVAEVLAKISRTLTSQVATHTGQQAGVARSPSSTDSPNGKAFTKGGEMAIPADVLRFVNLSLLTATPTGIQDLSPESRQILRQIIEQARANPAAFRDQLSTVAQTMRGPR
jgi:hypothetical protein